MQEEWRDIPGFEGIYQVSNLGRIKRVKAGQGAQVGRITNGNFKNAPNSYSCIDLSTDGIRRGFKVHRLVMLAFSGPCPQGYEVNHKNGIRNDNRLENLEYVTPKENTRHAENYLHRPHARGEKHGRATITDVQVISIKTLLLNKVSLKEIQKITDIPLRIIQKIATNKTWKHIQVERGD